jgi:formate dehydrogenase major subunit
MTNHWIDLQHSDCILIQGSNAAENHPISFKWVLKAKDKGAEVIHVDPRFTRTSARSSMYAPLRSGTDIAFLGGMIKYILDHDLYFKDYVLSYTNAAFLVNPKFSFNDGLFSGYDAQKHAYDKSFPKGRQGSDQARRYAEEPALRLPADEKALRPVRSEEGFLDHGDARGGSAGRV